MTEANDSLARLLPPNQFVAVAACLIDRTTGSVTTCLAGHPPPLLLTSTGVIEIDAPHNPPLGVFAGRRFAGVTRDLPADAVLLAYTDGVTDSRQGGGLFGQEGIARVVRALPDRDPDRIARSVCAAAADFHDTSLPGDDRLVVAISRSTA
jgi:serine phosphatase RsbU (regulator of sigma subunit)